MDHSQLESEEMHRRQDEDYIASLKMIGEGGPVYEIEEEDHLKDVIKDVKLPRDYQ